MVLSVRHRDLVGGSWCQGIDDDVYGSRRGLGLRQRLLERWRRGRSVGEHQEAEPGEVQKKERSEFELKLKKTIIMVAASRFQADSTAEGSEAYFPICIIHM